MSQLDRRFPPLRDDERVVTHAGMTRAQQTNIILIVMALFGAVALYFYAQAEDRAAIATRDYSRCWTQSCNEAIAASFPRY